MTGNPTGKACRERSSGMRRASFDLLDHLVADLVVRPAENAQHIHPAHDPDQPARIVNHRQPLHPAVTTQPLP